MMNDEHLKFPGRTFVIRKTNNIYIYITKSKNNKRNLEQVYLVTVHVRAGELLTKETPNDGACW